MVGAERESLRLIDAIRAVERQQQVSGYASEAAWRYLEQALRDIDGRRHRPPGA